MKSKPFDALSPIPASERIKRIEELGGTLELGAIKHIVQVVGLDECPYLGREVVAIAGIRAIERIVTTERRCQCQHL